MIRNPITGDMLAEDEAYENHHMSSKLYVGNLPFTVSESDLRQAFSQYGSISEVYIANDRETGRPRGFAFVTMSTPDEGKRAIDGMNGADLGGRALTVNEARPREAASGGFNSERRSFSGNRR